MTRVLVAPWAILSFDATFPKIAVTSWSKLLMMIFLQRHWITMTIPVSKLCFTGK